MTPLQNAILQWYASAGRTLPWRDVDDPYPVLVSEIMLQQTQVSRVLPIFGEFLWRFPDIDALAAAPRAEVVQAWRGLGYNRRAVALHRAAQDVVARFGSQIPADLEALRSLPGVGEYTARALLAFAFRRDAAPVDTNIRRVISRAVEGRALTGAALQGAADAAVPAGAGRDWSAALMDLGAQYCASRPACPACPVVAHCAWAGAAGPDPAATAAKTAAAPFAGSTRYHRGRLLDALRDGALDRSQLGDAALLDDAGAVAAVVAGLVRDGLAEWDRNELKLPA